MRTNLIYGILCLLLAGMGSGCKNAAEGGSVIVEKGKIELPANALAGITYKAGITAAERERLRIDTIATDGVKAKSNRELARGKQIYRGPEGTLETFAVMAEDDSTAIYLASYDLQGKLLDCIRIEGGRMHSGDKRKCIVEGNRMKIRYAWAEPQAGRGEGLCAIHTIADDLHFVPFSWPPEAFPCEMPFMTHEYEGDAPFGWKIASIVCTGVSDHSYLFSIRGQGADGGCKNAARKELTVKLHPMDQQREPAGETVTVALPAVDAGETFEAEIKIPKSKLDKKTLTWFRLAR
ncbi:MAG: hypothetical protein LBP50_02250 [Tannerella sp.]|jgi:hypothetical protein|nr:hypothetical protein [Tannerella sp.]